MLITCLFMVFVINSAQSQINGEFWWTNKKLNNFRNVQPSAPEIEVLGEFDTDESAKIIFRDDESYMNKLVQPVNHRSDKQRRYGKTSDQIVWPTDDFQNKNNNKTKENMVVLEPTEESNTTKDELVFNFPKNEKFVINVILNSTETIPQVTKKTENDLSGEFLVNNDRDSTISNKDMEAQNVCTYTTSEECFKSKGVIYYEKRIQTKPNIHDMVCCILPIKPIPKNDDFSAIYFPGPTNKKPRHKRSEDDKSQNQRKLLLLRKFSHHQKVQVATPKIVTPAEDDYDPYWNIKNSKFQTQLKDKIVTPSYNYDHDDYEDYASELPRPGLIGLYSDQDKSPSSWTFSSNGFSYGGVPSQPEPDDYEEDDDDEDDSFGYSTFSTIDPRGINKKRKPVKFTTVSDEVTLNAESHTINFQSNPDFQVLQGFKLLNLFRNRSRILNKRLRTTTESIDDSKEFLGIRPVESSEVGDEFFEEDQLFGGCGKAVAIRAKDKDKQAGDAASGSHPWMVLVVLTKRRQNVLCYGTLIHPRAAVTVADCVHGSNLLRTSPRDITVIAGAWDLTDRSQLKNRVADIHVHPKYKAGDEEHNLAVLYWMRPLKLGINTQPACLGEPHVGDECRFFGWGNLGQGIQSRPRWQRAFIKLCSSQLKKPSKTSEHFCVTTSRNSVTGLGGPLICDIDDHNTVVGIVVSIDNGYVLMPVRDFAMKSNELVSGD